MAPRVGVNEQKKARSTRSASRGKSIAESRRPRPPSRSCPSANPPLRVHDRSRRVNAVRFRFQARVKVREPEDRTLSTTANEVPARALAFGHNHGVLTAILRSNATPVLDWARRSDNKFERFDEPIRVGDGCGARACERIREMGGGPQPKRGEDHTHEHTHHRPTVKPMTSR